MFGGISPLRWPIANRIDHVSLKSPGLMFFGLLKHQFPGSAIEFRYEFIYLFHLLPWIGENTSYIV